jgi:hypothetical protein
MGVADEVKGKLKQTRPACSSAASSPGGEAEIDSSR